MTSRRIPCPHPGCTRLMYADARTCREHIDWRAVSHPPAAYFLERTCKGCGVRFQIVQASNLYCLACRTRRCRVCGQAMIQSPTKGQTVCSPDCAAILRAVPTLTCARCGAPFRQWNGHATKFCGRACRYLASRADEDTTVAAQRRGYRYKQWRNAVLARDDCFCRHCGATESLHAHHVQRWHDAPALRYDVSNGLTLCQPCHSRVHGAKITPMGRRRQPCIWCGKALKGRAHTGLCQPCSTRHWRHLRPGVAQGQLL